MISLSTYSGYSSSLRSRAAFQQKPAVAPDAKAPGPETSAALTSGLAAAAPPKADYRAAKYEKYFATREGSAPALAMGAVDPGYESLSADKSLAEVVATARRTLDEGYAEMNGSAEPYDPNAWEGRDDTTLFQDFDRRALNAVVATDDGTFTEAERQTARALMIQQQSLATGVYSGPAALAESFSDPFEDEPLSRARAAINFFEQASPEEKLSIAYAMDRATAELSYESLAKDQAVPAAHRPSSSPLVQLLKEAAREQGGADPGRGAILDADDLRALDWMAEYRQRLDSVLDAQAKPVWRRFDIRV